MKRRLSVNEWRWILMPGWIQDICLSERACFQLRQKPECRDTVCYINLNSALTNVFLDRNRSYKKYILTYTPSGCDTLTTTSSRLVHNSGTPQLTAWRCTARNPPLTFHWLLENKFDKAVWSLTHLKSLHLHAAYQSSLSGNTRWCTTLRQCSCWRVVDF